MSMDSGDCETEEDSAPEACVSPEGPQLPSNSREMRNRAEKMRRDKLNSYIQQLSALVPMVSGSPKRMDKTSILRLTAVYLRMNQLFPNGDCKSHIEIPKQVDQYILEQLVCEQLRGFLLILTGTGKIIFISHTVEKLLGHLQTDLMGQSIYSLVCPEDERKLKMYLSSNGLTDTEWRKYFNIRLKRAGPRTESPVYESVNVMGMQRTVDGRTCASSSNNCRDMMSAVLTSPGSSPGSSMSSTSSSNNDVFVFFIKTFRPEPLSDRLMEASKDEYNTRHLIDGRIVSCDQRISVIAGYFTEEVNGLSAFNFMHKEDVRWVMIALRQMYDREESRGSSCYRLLSKNGQFVFLRTHGYLEVDSTGTVESFFCINAMVSEKEGMRLIQEMKERYSAFVKMPAVNSLICDMDSDPSSSPIEDPKKLQEAITCLVTDLPLTTLSSPQSDDHRSTPSPHYSPQIVSTTTTENQDCSSSTTDCNNSYNSSAPYQLRLKPAATKRQINGDGGCGGASTSSPTSSKKRHKRSPASDYVPLPLPSPPATSIYHRPNSSDVSATSSIYQSTHHQNVGNIVG